ncbi:hypothetical protein AJ80_09304 [Polytolypa hystricis UAMH7299]|uniref:Uncharacterized protein n=1 Tax=Polytolypa hystricis (strain UAMH7299) TaxID=1447883 RepID=A0A2B7WT93_POLH7|nr:hypothetical protein AJ80_09304 [Polytolypa hystricis UAMH7299]
MESLQFTPRETQLATERRLKFQGTAKVNLDDIYFDSQSSRQLDQKNIDRLCRIFQEEGCQNLSLAHHVPAVVCRNHLAAALGRANSSAHALLTAPESDPPLLRFQPGQLQGLHGRHRIAAGLQRLSPTHRWWAVDIYLDDLGEDLKTTLIEEYSNEKPPSDGEIYRKIRQYANDGNLHGELRWKARLCPNSQARLNSLNKNTRLRHAFDGVLGIPGHRSAMRISMLHRVLAVRCDEEIAHYLNYVRDFWLGLLDDGRASVAKLDQHTVEELELMAPCIEAKKVQGLILSGQIFADFDEDGRAAIWEKLRLFNGLVPSLHSFFEDFKCLESWAHCLTRLFAAGRYTIHDTMRDLRIHPGATDAASLVQTSESGFSSRAVPAAAHFHLAYRQMWLYAMRHYPEMPRDAKRKSRLAKPQSATADECVVSDMARLARQLGFESDEITDLVNQSPDRMIARHALLRARKPDRFVYADSAFDSLVDQIVDCFATAMPRDAAPPPPLMSPAVTRKARCGHPTVQALLQDRPLLFLDRMQAAETQGRVTTLFVRRCVYLAFFGPRPTIHQGESHSPQSEDDPLPSLPISPLFIPESSPMDDLQMDEPESDRHAPSTDGQGSVVMTSAADTDGRGLSGTDRVSLAAAESGILQTDVGETTAAPLAVEMGQPGAECQGRPQAGAEATAAAEEAEQERLRREAEEVAAAARAAEQEQLRERAAAEQEKARSQRRAVAELAAAQGRERQLRKEMADNMAQRAQEVEERAASHSAELRQLQEEKEERVAEAADSVRAEMASRVKEAEDLLAAQEAELGRLRQDARDVQLEDFLREDAELRAASEHDLQDSAWWEAERAAAVPVEQERPRKEADVEMAGNREGSSQQEEARAMAPAQSQTRPESSVQPEADALFIQAPRPVTQLDLSALVERWREMDSDNPQSLDKTPERTTQRQRRPGLTRIRKSHMKGRPTRQAANHEAGRLAAVADHLGLDLEDPGSAANPQAAQPRGEGQENRAEAPAQEGAGGRLVVEATPLSMVHRPQDMAAIQPASDAGDGGGTSGGTDETVARAEPTLSLPETTASTTRVQFDTSADKLEYDPTRYRLTKLTRSTLTDPGSTGVAADETLRSQLSVPSIEPERAQASRDGMISITMYFYERDRWKVDKVLSVNPSDPSSLERTVWGYRRRNILVYDAKMRTVGVPSSFQAATADGTNMLLLIPRQVKEQIDPSVVIRPPSPAGGPRSKRMRL